MGWDPDTGKPTRATLEQLGINGNHREPRYGSGGLKWRTALRTCVSAVWHVLKNVQRSPSSGRKGKSIPSTLERVLSVGSVEKSVSNKPFWIRPGNVALSVNHTEWPKPILDKEACISCNMCIQICPVSCLSLSEASAKGLHRYPHMEDPALCIACGFCAEDCPVDAIGMVADLPSKA